MRIRVWAMCAAAGVSGGMSAGTTLAQDATRASAQSAYQLLPPPTPDAGSASNGTFIAPPRLALVDEPRSVYPEIIPSQSDQPTNQGGVHFDLNFSWYTRYVYRGVDQSPKPREPENAEQFNGSAEFDLGKLPHPFIGLFVNVFNNDPVSRFEEVRPYFGLDWTIKPLTVTSGYTTYIFPNRKVMDTQEVFLQLTLDDSRLFHTEHPLLQPYIYGAYDLDKYKGFYLEAGVQHDFVFEDWGFTLTPYGKIAYVISQPYFELPGGRDYGLQHYELGVVGSVSLNHAFNLSRRYGDWSVEGYLRYSDSLDSQLRAATVIWGGAGLNFRY